VPARLVRRLWESGIILITCPDLTGKIIEVNDAGLRCWFYSRAELSLVSDGRITPREWDTPTRRTRATGATGVALPGRRAHRKMNAGVNTRAAAILSGNEGSRCGRSHDRKRAEKDLLERMRIAALTADIG